MSNSKFTYITRLMTTYNLEIDIGALSNNLKCTKCKLVLKDACQTPCGCRFCSVCIDNLMASGSEFCPGVAKDCGESLLSDSVTDFRANKSVSKLAVKCPQNGCVHVCELAELEEHMRVCGRKSVACPFHELGCQKDKLAAEEMSGHFQQASRSHSEILIRMIADINKEMESQKREIEMLKRSDESKKAKIKMLKRSDKSRKSENEMLKHELVVKDEQIKSIIDQMVHVENENKSIKSQIKLINKEKADLADRLQILSEKIDREIDDRRESDERDMANVIENIDTEITAITAVIGSNKNEMDTTMRSVEDDIRSMKQDSMKSIQDNIICIKSQMQSIQTLVGLIDASCEWTINGDIAKIRWSEGGRLSEYFIGAVHPYKYRLSSWNIDGILCIYLRIYSGASDAQLPWPFSGRVAISVMDRNKCKARQSITLQCQIRRPADNQYISSAQFMFSHSSLIRAGLDLARGVHVSCLIVPSSAI